MMFPMPTPVFPGTKDDPLLLLLDDVCGPGEGMGDTTPTGTARDPLTAIELFDRQRPQSLFIRQ